MAKYKIDALVAFLHSPVARKFRLRPGGYHRLHIHLNNRTPGNLAPLRDGLIGIFGNPNKMGKKGRETIVTPYGEISVLRSITPDTKPPDAVIFLTGKHKTAFNAAMKERKQEALRRELSAPRSII